MARLCLLGSVAWYMEGCTASYGVLTSSDADGAAASGAAAPSPAGSPLCPNQWPCDGSLAAQPFDSLGFHRFRVTLPPARNQNDTGVRATIPWRRRSTPNLTSPVAVRDVVGNVLNFTELNRSMETLDLIISRDPNNSSSASVCTLPRYLPPFPWLPNAGSASINHVVADTGGGEPAQPAWKAMDGIAQFGAARPSCTVNNGWDAGGGAEYLIIDVQANTTIDAFALITAGDTVHDPFHMLLQIGPTKSGPWSNVSAFVGNSSGSQQHPKPVPQVFSGFHRSAQFWKWTILDRHSPFQGFVAEVFFRAARVVPKGYRANNVSTAIASSGSEPGADAFKVVDGIDAFIGHPDINVCKDICQGWNAAPDEYGTFIIFDLGPATTLVGFAMLATGDGCHDPKEMQLRVGDSPTPAGTWKAVTNFTGQASSDLQEFTFPRATSRYWQLNIVSVFGEPSRISVPQAWIREVFFKPSISPPMPTPVAPSNQLPQVPGFSPPGPPPAPLPPVSEALVYILPFSGGGSGMDGVRYSAKGQSSVDDWYLPEPSEFEQNLEALSVAPPGVYEGRDDFSAFTDMEFAATPAETAAVTAAHPVAQVLIWHEPRESPIRMYDRIPVSWSKRAPVATVPSDGTGGAAVALGIAKRGEHFMFQLGLLAVRGVDAIQVVFGALSTENSSIIPPGAMSSPALGGTDSLGRRFNRTISVPQNHVGVLWVAIDVNETTDPGEYRGALTVEVFFSSSGASDSVSAAQPARTTVDVVLVIDANETVTDGGDHQPIQTLSRARWLDSTAGQSDHPVARFQPLQTSTIGGAQIISSAAQMKLSETGLPLEISRKGEPSSNMLQAPIVFVAVDSDGHSYKFVSDTPVMWSGTQSGHSVSWTATAHVNVLSLALSLAGEMHSDGALEFSINVSNTANAPLQLENLMLIVPFREAAVPYAMGLGKTGGRRPQQWSWRWMCALGSQRGNHMLWAGDPFLGMRLKLKGNDSSWNSGMKIVTAADVPLSWGGDVDFVHSYGPDPAVTQTVFRGGMNVSEANGGVVSVSAFSGARELSPKSAVTFNFELLITPAQPFSPRVRFSQRYTQQGGGLPLDKPGIDALVNNLVDSGAVTINIHQGATVNPYINYVTAPEIVPALSEYSRQIHARNGTLKVYYTTRELSDHVDLMWVLRSLGGEVIDSDTAGDDTQASSYGYAWLQEHLGNGYKTCWANPLAPTPWHPDSNGVDASVCDADIGVEQQTLRWENYYVRGLQYIMENPPYVDGLYLDGVAYDSRTMKRVRTVMDETARARSGPRLIDMHSGNNFPEAAAGSSFPSFSYPDSLNRTCQYGCVSPALSYMQHMPYMDSTMFGEGFNYDTPADYYLIEISSQSWGLGNDMLGGGNPWRGMVFGMVTRYGSDPTNKTAMWSLWDEFDLGNAEMLGWWHPQRVVTVAAHDATSNCSEVYATAFVHYGSRAMVAVGSWQPGPETQNCTLIVEWSYVGFNASSMNAPEIGGFQAAATMQLGAAIPISPAKGVLLVLEASA